MKQWDFEYYRDLFRMISVMRTKLGQNVEEMLERWCF